MGEKLPAVFIGSGGRELDSFKSCFLRKLWMAQGWFCGAFLPSYEQNRFKGENIYKYTSLLCLCCFLKVKVMVVAG